MPNVEDLLCSNTVTVELIKNSPTKRAIVLSAGTIENDEYGKTRLNILVEVDGKQKFYRPNKTSLDRLAREWGTLTDQWPGKAMSFRIEEIKNREAVIASPETAPKTEQVGG